MAPRQRKNFNTPLAFFFLKRFFFNPLNNPVFVLAALFIVFFYMEGSLDKYHVALILCLSPVVHYFIGNMFRDSANMEEEKSPAPLKRFFQALPVSGRSVYFSYLFSAMIYVLLTYFLLGFLLTKLMKLPDLQHRQFIQSVAPDGDTVTTLTGFDLSPRGIPRFVSVIVYKSLLFDSISKAGGGALWISLYYVQVFVYICVFQAYKQLHARQPLRTAAFLHKLPLGIYLFAGLVFASELILSQKETGSCTRFVLQHVDIVLLLFLATLLVTFLSIVLMSRKILERIGVADI